MKENVGYEHFFMYYYLYLPLNVQCEYDNHKESLETLKKLGIIKNHFQLEKIINENKYKVVLDNYSKLIHKIEETYKSDKENLLKLTVKKYDKNDNEILFAKDNTIYGDIKLNDDVEVQLDQRSRNKIKYKKNNYSEQHIFNTQLHTELIKFADALVKIDNNNTIDKDTSVKNHINNNNNKYSIDILNSLAKLENLCKYKSNNLDINNNIQFDDWYKVIQKSNYRLKLINLKEFYCKNN
jgi:hypothetical protein